MSSPLAFSSPYRIDAQAPLSHGWYIKSLSCPTITLCVGADEQGNLLTTTDPTAPPAGWDRFSIGSYGESEVSCPTASLCVALGDDQGSATVLESTDPTGGPGAWHSGPLPDAGPIAESLTCPTASFCAALTSNGTIVTTDDPAGGASTWTASSLTTNGGGGAGGTLSCASASLCLISDGSQGTLYTSTDPTGGPAAWSQGQVAAPIGHLSCPTTQLCVGVGLYGIGLEVSTDPAAGASSWSETDLDPSTGSGNGTPQVTCTASAFCMVMDPDGSVITSHDPAGGAAAWSTVAQVPVPAYGAIDGITWPAAPTCPEDQFCVAATARGDVAVSTDPAGPSGSWPIHSVDGYNSLTGVSCTSDADCVAVDDAGNVLSSSQPELPQLWAATHIDGHPLSGVSCIPGGPCVAVDAVGDVLSSSDPTGGPSAWSTSDVDPGNDILAVSCASGPVCMAVDNAGDLLLSVDPTGGADAWSVANMFTPGGPGSFTGVSCANAGLCVASGPYWLEVVQNPGQPDAAWKQIQPGNAVVESNELPFYTSVSCAATDYCATTALTTSGWASGDPTGGGLAWTAAPIPSQGFTGGLACQSSTLCVYAGPDDTIYESSDPTSTDGTAWGQATPDLEVEPDDLTGAACPSAQFCIAVGESGDAWAGEGSGYTAPPAPSGSSGGGSSGGSGGGAGSGPGDGASGNGSPGSTPSAPAAPAAPPSPSSQSMPAPADSGASGSESRVAPRGHTSATVRLRLRSPALTRRTVRARISCTAASGRCAGAITLSTSTRRQLVLASTHFDVRAGRTETISFPLSHRTADLLRDRHVRRLLVRAVLSPSSTVRRSFSLSCSMQPPTPLATRSRPQANSSPAASRIS
ncbi:MAG TPA: hypothetical protein VMF07_15740 [Solirubrobacteraceae bacterium]|nr:hypothetical protein [Solirubrobacteraceae bacterium]